MELVCIILMLCHPINVLDFPLQIDFQLKKKISPEGTCITIPISLILQHADQWLISAQNPVSIPVGQKADECWSEICVTLFGGGGKQHIYSYG